MTVVKDRNGTPIVVGSLVEDEGGPYGTVTEITEPDADMGDLGPVYISPYVRVQYHDCEDQFPCSFPSPYRDEFVCDDVVVVGGGSGGDA